MYCVHCGQPISNDAKFCNECGKPTTNVTTTIETNQLKKKKPFYKKTWFWVVIILYIFSASVNKQQTTPLTTLSQQEQFIADFCEESKMSTDAANALYSFMVNDLKAQEVQFVENYGGNISWKINADGFNVLVAADEDGIYRAICGDYVLYEDSKILYSIPDLNSRRIGTDRYSFAVIAKCIVEDSLKAPSTAKFPNSEDFQMERLDNFVTVSGYVDAQNSFGVMIRNDFVVQFYVLDIETFQYTPTYIRLGDQSSGEYVEIE